MVRFTKLREEAAVLGKPQWRPVLEYLADLHERCIHPAAGGLPYEWEDIGPGYCYGPAFGHWDLIHAIMDALPAVPEHALRQIRNNLTWQQEDGLIPGSLWMKQIENDQPQFSRIFGHPPMWIYAVDDYCRIVGSSELIRECLPHLKRQIGWFESKRKSEPEGFYYLDILTNEWESGVDEGIRFLDTRPGPQACIDASSHVFALYDCAARWTKIARQPDAESAMYAAKAQALGEFIRGALYSPESGFFHDIWSVNDAAKRHYCFDGFWPLVCGVASEEQARRLIDESLLNPERFLTEHPVPTVAVCDSLFEQRMWRGPAWNSMTYWIARGCVRYGRPDAARIILERALDATAMQYERTGAVWEFYHSSGGDQMQVQRKPHTEFNTPCRDYVGHCPLFAMARIYADCLQ